MRKASILLAGFMLPSEASLAAPAALAQKAEPQIIDIEGALRQQLADCSKSSVSDEVVVCAKSDPDRKYRLNAALRAADDQASVPTDRTRRLSTMRTTRSGTGVCAGASGAAGWTGCSMHEWKIISGKAD